MANKEVNTVDNVDYKYGPDISVYNNKVYRVYDKGIISIDHELNLLNESYIGAATNNSIYAMAINDDLICVGLTSHPVNLSCIISFKTLLTIKINLPLGYIDLILSKLVNAPTLSSTELWLIEKGAKKPSLLSSKIIIFMNNLT